MFSFLEYPENEYRRPIVSRLARFVRSSLSLSYRPWEETYRLDERLLPYLYLRPTPSLLHFDHFRWVFCRRHPSTFICPQNFQNIAQGWVNPYAPHCYPQNEYHNQPVTPSSWPDIVPERPPDYPLHIIPSFLILTALLYNVWIPRTRLGDAIRAEWEQTEEGRRRIVLVDSGFSCEKWSIVEVGFNAVGEICTLGTVFYWDPQPLFVRFRMNGSVIIVVLNNRWDGRVDYFSTPAEFLSWIYSLHRPFLSSSFSLFSSFSSSN